MLGLNPLTTPVRAHVQPVAVARRPSAPLPLHHFTPPLKDAPAELVCRPRQMQMTPPQHPVALPLRAVKRTEGKCGAITGNRDLLTPPAAFLCLSVRPSACQWTQPNIYHYPALLNYIFTSLGTEEDPSPTRQTLLKMLNRLIDDGSTALSCIIKKTETNGNCLTHKSCHLTAFLEW